MKSAIINISFNQDLLRQLDFLAKEESRSRSELIREATRMYIERRKRWDTLFSIAASRAKETNLAQEDVVQQIKLARKQRKQ